MGDERFSALSNDPRYRLPSRKEARTAVDPRFGRLFKDADFQQKASVDRYGRKVKSDSGRKEMERLYRLEKPRELKQGGQREVVGSSDESEDDEDDKDVEVESLEVKDSSKRDPARQGGFSDSEEENSDEEEDSELDDALAEETAGQEQTEDIPMGEVTRRIAVVNLDWDHIRATDIMQVASSFLPSNGRVESVVVYPSEFGRERLEREELEGPPREIFSSSKQVVGSNGGKELDRERDDESDGLDSTDDEPTYELVDTDSDDEDGLDDASDDDEDSKDEDEKIKKRLLQEQANEGSEFDTAKLRQYQLERLRYYYAVIACDSSSTAKILYDAMDGREYLSTANFFDMRFIPEETSFEDDQPRDTCNELVSGYKPNDFRTEALMHSKVRLTWDDDDTTRKEVQKRAFSRAEIDENDLQAYIGSDSSDADSVTSRKSTAEKKKATKQEAQRIRMRAALGLADKSSKSTSATAEPVGDMQITFTSGLVNGNKKGTKDDVFENEPQDEVSTRERYIRKEKERKQKRKEKMKAERSGTAADSGTDEEDAIVDAGKEVVAAEDAGFDDPFFTDPAAATAVEKKTKKAERLRKREEKQAREAEDEARRVELELLMAEDQGDKVRHFDMREIEKAEKDAKRKHKSKKEKKRKQQQADGDEVADQFELETQDPRFKALFESHEYAIDPTNPKFNGTGGMKALLEEGRKKRKVEEFDEQPQGKQKEKKAKADHEGDDELNGLVAKLKGKKSRTK